MDYFVYVESEDSCGEGTRATLYKYRSREAASQQFNRSVASGEATKVEQIEGTIISSWSPNSGRELNTDELRKSDSEG